MADASLTVVDNDIRESLAIDVGQRLEEADVVNTLNRIAAQRDCRPLLRSIMAAVHFQNDGQMGVRAGPPLLSQI